MRDELGSDPAAALDNIADAFFALDDGWRFTYLNREAERLLGRRREELVGKNVWEEFPEAVSSTFYREYHRARAEGTAAEFEEFYAPLETWFGVKAYPSGGGLAVYFRDATQRKREQREREERLRAILVRYSSDVIAILEADGTIRYESPAVERVLGYGYGQRVGENAFSYLHPDDLEVARAVFGEILGGAGARGPVELRYRHADGSWRWLEGVGNNLLCDPDVGGIVVNFRDVTERREVQEALRESEERLEGVLASLEEVVWSVCAETFEALYVSPAAERLYGRPVPEFFADPSLWLEVVHPEDRGRVERSIATIMREGHSEDEYRIVRPDGEVRWVHDRSRLVRDASGAPLRVDGIDIDVTERKALEGRLEHQATHDALTGLPNRALFSERVGHALSRAERRGGTVAVLFVDLDNFKYVNDTLGHDAGDGMLVAVAGRLRSCLRPQDTAARLGGDEFAVLLEDVSGAGQAERVAERIAEALREPLAVGGREAFVTLSIGVALAHAGRDASPGDLLREADLALYEAKGTGKARHATFGSNMEARVVERLKLENDLRRAAGNPGGEFAVRYQPVVRLGGTEEGRRVVGFEALLRWEYPERGLLAPSDFLPLAEELGLTVPVGRWLLGEACRRTKEWQGLYPRAAPLAVGANLSARQLSHPGLLADALAATREAGLVPEQVTLEVTEEAVIGDAGRHPDALRELRDAGFLLALDDFGTGYSSLSYLKRLPVGLVKIDRSFVEGLGEDGREEDEVLLSGIVGIAHGLGLLVVAEGVENQEQLGRIEKMGCDLAQGRLFSAPLGAEEASALLARDLGGR